MEKAFRIADLIVKEIKGEISNLEKLELEEWLSALPENRLVYEKAINKDKQLSKLEVYHLFDKDKTWRTIEKEIFKTKTQLFIPKTIIKYAAAILLPLFIIGGASYFYLTKKANISYTQIDTVIKPGVQKATLVLSNGGIVELCDEKPFTAINEGNAQIQNEDNVLSYAYEETINEPEQEIYNELVTPRGGGYNLKLADGTLVWLNADSKLNFPVSFTDSTRTVYLEGEAYFEVAESKTRAFIVKTIDYNIKVYGTSFNVSAYPFDKSNHTTLVHGSVGITTKTGSDVRIIPGEQAFYNKSENRLTIMKVDTYAYTAWKDGKFVFDNTSLEEIMLKLGRWYNAETKYLDNDIKNFHFSGTLDKSDEVADILNIIALTTHIEFTISGNVIWVNQKKNK